MKFYQLLISCIASYVISLSLCAETRILSTWTVELVKPQVQLDRFQEYRMGAITNFEGRLLLSTPQGGVECRDLKTGGPLWEAKLEGISQSPWIKNESMVYGADTKGTVYALDWETGERRWAAPTKGVYFAAPQVVDNLVLFLNSVGTLQAFDRATGSWVWQQSDPSILAPSLWSGQGPLIWNGQIIQGFPSSLLQAFEPATGKLLWKESFAQQLASVDSINDLKALAVHQDLLAASSFGGDLKVWLMKNKARTLLWTKPLSLYASPIFMNEGSDLLVVTKEGSVILFEARTGNPRWKKELPRGLGAKPLVQGNRIWLPTSGGQVFVFDLSGQELARTNTYESPIWNEATSVGSDEVVVMTIQGVLRKLHLVDLGPNSGLQSFYAKESPESRWKEGFNF